MRDTLNSQLSTLNLFSILALGSLTFGLTLATPLLALDPEASIEVLALNAQRYQNFMRSRIQCEVLGEIKNISDRTLTGVTIILDFLDEKGKVIATEEADLVLKIIAPRKSRGEVRPIRPQEVGNFSQDTTECPRKWLEGRVQYRIKNVEWEE